MYLVGCTEEYTNTGTARYQLHLYTKHLYLDLASGGFKPPTARKYMYLSHQGVGGYWIIIMFNRMTKYYTTVSQSKYTKVPYLLMYLYTYKHRFSSSEL